MKLIHDLSQMPALEGSVVTDGMFDGVHLGHQRILKQVVEKARELNLPSVVLTYWPHPRHVLGGKEARVSLLTTLTEKAELIAHQGIDYMLVLSFSKSFSQLSHEDFVRNILAEGLHTRHLIVGYDHRFGLNRIGDIRYLSEVGKVYGFGLTEIGKQEIEAIAISSTKIRYSLQNFLVDSASQFLGRPYSLRGMVVKGDQRGRTIGFPTANLEPDEKDKLVPKDGVYATRTRVGETWYSSMTNIGFRPTVDGHQHKIETHLFDFEGDLYDQIMEVAFVKPLRTEMKFASLDELKSQLAQDREMARAALKE